MSGYTRNGPAEMVVPCHFADRTGTLCFQEHTKNPTWRISIMDTLITEGFADTNIYTYIFNGML